MPVTKEVRTVESKIRKKEIIRVEIKLTNRKNAPKLEGKKASCNNACCEANKKKQEILGGIVIKVKIRESSKTKESNLKLQLCVQLRKR